MKPTEVFWSTHYIRHNQRRQEHLASLGLPLAKETVLEVGAGIGDHTSFFTDRGCPVIVTEAQEQNLALLRERHPALDVRELDLNNPPQQGIEVDIVYCYGVLYHLEDPAVAIAWMARSARKMLLLETCVAAGSGEELRPFEETPQAPENAVTGHGCRPTRPWVRAQLARQFSHVYVPITQPCHEEFPLDWSAPELVDEPLTRAVFVASHVPLVNPMLTTELPLRQVRDAHDANVTA